MPVNTLDTIDQLKSNKPIKLGTSDEPCCIKFGLSKIDEDKPWRAISIIPNADDLKVLLAFDAANADLNDIVFETDDGDRCIKVKVHKRFTKVFNDTNVRSDLISVIDRDVNVRVVVKPSRWKWDGQEGIKLNAHLIVDVDDGIGLGDL